MKPTFTLLVNVGKKMALSFVRCYLKALGPGITPKVLAKELKELEQHKLVNRIITDDPVKISYKLEAYADTLTPIIYSLKEWGVNHHKKLFKRNNVIGFKAMALSM